MRTTLRQRSSPARSGVPAPRALAVLVVTAFVVALTGPAASATKDPLVTVTVIGTIENIAVDSNDSAAGPEAGATLVEPFVVVAGTLFDLPDDTAVPAARTGQPVEITLAAPPGTTGTEALEQATDDDAATPAHVVEIQQVTDPAGPAATLGVAETPTAVGDSVVGAHLLTILPVYWTAPDVTLGALSTLGSQTADYWREQSAGQLVVLPSVQPWSAIPAPASCDSAALSAMFAAAMAANPTVPAPTATNHVLVYFPRFAACPFAGRAAILGGYIWDNGYTYPDVVAHEFGHNLGLGHANTTSCTAGGTRVPLSATCTMTEYGDYADVMGIAMARTSGNLNSALADFLGYANVLDIPSGSPGVTVDLAPLAQVSAVRAVKIQVPTGTLYLDFRPAVGRDVRMPAWAGVQAHLRTIDRWGTPATVLLDMRPLLSLPFASPAVLPGVGWAVPGTGLTVIVTRVGATATVSVVPMATREAYVTRVYSNLFGRVPDAAGLAGWVAALQSGTPRVAVANAITSSDEYRRTLIAGSYQAYLGRGPDPSGAAAWLGQMRIGVTIQQMEAGFLASPEYFARAGATNAEWVQHLYGHVLRRGASEGEVVAWERALSAGGSRYQVSMGFLLSTEHLSTVVNSYYVRFLGRGIDQVGRAGWVNAIQAGSRVEAIIGGIIASDEYFATT